jgi:hypothetical protein
VEEVEEEKMTLWYSEGRSGTVKNDLEYSGGSFGTVEEVKVVRCDRVQFRKFD